MSNNTTVTEGPRNHDWKSHSAVQEDEKKRSPEEVMRWQNSGAEPVEKRPRGGSARPRPGRRCWEAERVCAPTSKIRPRGDIPAGRRHEGGQPEIMGLLSHCSQNLRGRYGCGKGG